MKTWSSEYTFKHNWETVVQATARKYPNPYNNNVTSIDVVERQLCPQTGALLSHRLVASEFAIARQFGRLYASEFTAIHPRARRMVMRTKNLSLSSLLTAREHLEYRVHPDNPEWTQLVQSVEIEAFPTIADTIIGVSRSNAGKGRKAIEWVIQTQMEQPLLDFLSAPLAAVGESPPAALLDSCLLRMRAELDELSEKAVQLSRDLGDELSTLGGDIVASVSSATAVHAAAPQASSLPPSSPPPPSTSPVSLSQSLSLPTTAAARLGATCADEHFMIL